MVIDLHGGAHVGGGAVKHLAHMADIVDHVAAPLDGGLEVEHHVVIGGIYAIGAPLLGARRAACEQGCAESQCHCQFPHHDFL
jgi:hypothetical protein